MSQVGIIKTMREVFGLYCESWTNPMTTIWGQNVEFVELHFLMLNPVICDEKSVLPSELQHSLCAIYNIGLPSYCIRQHPADSVTVLFLVCYCRSKGDRKVCYMLLTLSMGTMIQQCSRVFGCSFNLHY